MRDSETPVARNEATEPYDLVADIMAFEIGDMPDEDVPGFFQRLIDTGVIRHLQGSYQRTARRLVEAGLCHW